MQAQFEAAYQKRFSFLMPARALIVEAISVEAVGASDAPLDAAPAWEPRSGPLAPLDTVPMYCDGQWRPSGLYAFDALRPGDAVNGPAIITDANATTVIEPGWRADVTTQGHLVLRRVAALPARLAIGTRADPVMLEIFNNLFMSIAEQMGLRLQNTAHSVNIKERLDFSCAIFDASEIGRAHV